MKRFIFLITTIFICTITHAQTIDIDWLVGNSVYNQSTCEYGGDLIVPTAPTKYGYTFNGWVSYTPIEYLESTGTQYINTGVYPNSDNVIYEASWLEKRLEISTSLFGSTRASWSGVLYHIGSGTTYLAAANSDGLCSQGNIVVGKKNYIRIELVNNLLTKTQNNATCTTSYRGTIVNGANISLFGNNNSELSRYTQLYYFKMWDNDVLVRDFIPVLDGDGVPCMYDKVEGKFYYNAGTGQFIAGPIINE